MSNEQKPGDPADKGADQFQPTVSHRAGYGDDKLTWLVDFLRRNPRATLASGEGALLLAEIDRLRAREIVMAQHEDTGRTWNGPRCAIPSRYFEVNPAEQEVGP